MSTTEKTTGRPWPKGTSGNPRGKPVGARHRSTVMLEKLLTDDAQTIVRAVLAAAAQGDMAAARMVIERLLPVPKDRPLHIDLPPTDTATGIAQAQATVIASVAAGELRPSEGQALASLLELRRRAVESEDFEARLTAIEARGPQ